MVAMADWEDSASTVGVSALEETVLGPAPVGERLLLLQFPQCGRRGDRQVIADQNTDPDEDFQVDG